MKKATDSEKQQLLIQTQMVLNKATHPNYSNEFINNLINSLNVIIEDLAEKKNSDSGKKGKDDRKNTAQSH